MEMVNIKMVVLVTEGHLDGNRDLKPALCGTMVIIVGDYTDRSDDMMQVGWGKVTQSPAN